MKFESLVYKLLKLLKLVIVIGYFLCVDVSSNEFLFLMEIDNGMIMLILDEPIANFFPTRPRFDSFSKASI